VNLEAGVCENWCHVEYLGLLSSDEVGNFFFTLLCFFAIFSFLNLVNNQLGCLYCFVVCLFFFWVFVPWWSLLMVSLFVCCLF
jgi:hypothetical protein